MAENGTIVVQPNYTQLVIEGGDTLLVRETRLQIITAGMQGPPGVGIPPGGLTGQVLAKSSNANYDTEWVSGGGGGIPLAQFNTIS